jgi:membrane protease YdiL (CAAX protease family)
VSQPDIEVTPLSLGRSVLLSLAPGLLTVGLSLLTSPWVQSAGFPPLLATLLSCVVGLGVLPLTIMLMEARRTSGRYSLLSVIPFRASVPRLRFTLWVGALLAWAMAVFAILTPISNALRDRLFDWMPSSFTAPIVQSRVSPTALLLTGAAALLLSPFVINPVEELYYRGYLLPRMSRLGRGAPYFNAALWALNHLWQPWGAPVFFLAMLPAILVVQRTRCVWLIVVGHSLGNFLMILAMVLMGTK